MKMTYSMRQQHALIKMNAIFKFACHKDVAKPKSLYISCPVSVFEYFCPELSKCLQYDLLLLAYMATFGGHFSCPSGMGGYWRYSG